MNVQYKTNMSALFHESSRLLCDHENMLNAQYIKDQNTILDRSMFANEKKNLVRLMFDNQTALDKAQCDRSISQYRGNNMLYRNHVDTDVKQYGPRTNDNGWKCENGRCCLAPQQLFGNITRSKNIVSQDYWLILSKEYTTAECTYYL